MYKIVILVVLGLFVSQIRAVSFDLEALTKSEKSAIKKLRLLVKDSLPHEYMKDDLYLIKWLTIKGFNVDQTVSLLKRHVKWREEQKIDGILSEDWELMGKAYPYYLDKVDKQGRPVLYFRYGSWDISELSNSGNLKILNRYFAKLLEDAEFKVREIKAAGHENVDQFNIVINLDGYTLARHGCYQCLSFYAKVGETLSEHYPGTANRIVFINAPNVFATTYSLLQTVLSDQTKDSIKLYGNDRHTWEPALMEFIDRGQFPGDLY